MPTIKMKKGYPTSDDVMHDTHAGAIKRQCEINFHKVMTDHQIDIDKMEQLSDNDADVLRDWLKYTRKNVTKAAAGKPAPKKKAARK